MLKRFLAVAFFAFISALSPAVDLPNPLAHVRAGQWVSYDIVMMGVKAEQRQSIVDVTGEGDERVLTMKVELLVDGQVMQSDEVKSSYKEAVALLDSSFDGQEVEVEPVVVEVKGESVKGVLIKYREEEMDCRLYLSEVVPVVGIVRLEIDDEEEPVMQLKDFGG